MTDNGYTFRSDEIARLRKHLECLYSRRSSEDVLKRLLRRLASFIDTHPHLQEERDGSRLDQTDVFLITYGDQMQEPGAPPLQSLDEALSAYAGDVLTGVHILPFFPYSSDDGFSVLEYRKVNPVLGDWADVEEFAAHFRLMVDFVCNHISAQSDWFRAFKAGEAPYTRYFITVDPDTDLSQVVRPRAHPLLTDVETSAGTKHVWTTFSEDQIDLNYANPDVLLEMTDVLLRYVHHGAELIRLDAVAYLWKEPGTRCIHLPQTHEVVKFWRTVLDIVAPRVLLITETNVPHAENVSYFGNGYDEAQLVYQFSLPLLTLHAFQTGDAGTLHAWANALSTPSDETTFFNFLASHDGIGIRPAEGILSREAIQELVRQTQARGGYVSYKTNANGSDSPYELNVNYYDALNDPAADEPQSVQIDRFMAAQAILLSIVGVPGIYVHSLFGSRGWPAGVEQTGRYRTINRRRFAHAELKRELSDPTSRRYHVFRRYRTLIKTRAAEPAFHPHGAQQGLSVDSAFFSFVRVAPDESSRVLCIHNVTNEERRFETDLSRVGISAGTPMTDLITSTSYTVDDNDYVHLDVPPYGIRWLRSGAT